VRTTVLLADHHDTRRAILRAAAAARYAVRETAKLDETLQLYHSVRPFAVLLGCDERAREVAVGAVAAVRRVDRFVPILLIVENGSEAFAVSALRAGVTDYLPYPVNDLELIATISRSATGAAAPALSAPPASAPFIGSSAAMQRVQAYLTQVAQGDANLLITGETGTGKELAASLVHERSVRRHGRFVTVNCAAIPDALLESELFGYEKGAFTGASTSRPGLLESANEGTVFLDEVGEMGLPAQAKILRAIEAREVYRVGGRVRVPLDIRVVAATNQELEEAVEARRFRRDLYFRLHVASVRLPPLRERPGDIAELLDHYLREFNARMRCRVGLSDEARQALDVYEWPGNVRELKNLVESLFVCPPSEPARIADLPEMYRRRLAQFCMRDDRERRALLDALFVARWNKSRAAEILDCSRMTLYRRMAKYDVVRSQSQLTPRARKA
jgi:DNA-binding NtrC family response regulator